MSLAAGTDPFDALGAELEVRWRAHDRDEECFPDVASDVLADHPPSTWFDRDAWIDRTLDPTRAAGQQLAPTGAFGQPGVTAFAGDGFVIEVYYWLDSLSAVHNHPFCGVFTVLEGYSVHARYAVDDVKRAGARGQVLDVRLEGLELVEAGHVQRFSLRQYPLIHALIHVPVPSISMVMRTVRTEGYLRYLPPSVAIPMEAPSEPLARRIALVESLVAADDLRAEDCLAATLREGDFETVVRVLAAVWGRTAPEARPALLRHAAALQGPRLDAIACALDRALRLEEATLVRSRLRDPDLRLVAAGLTYAETRTQVFELLAARGGDPLARLRRFVDDGGHFATDGSEEASRLIAHALVDGAGERGALRALELAYGVDAIADRQGDVAAYCRESVFAPLAR